MSENNQIMSVQGQLVGLPLAGPESFSQQQLEYLKRALGVDETVLFESNVASPGDTQQTYNLSESPLNFEKIGVYMFRPVNYGPWFGYTEFIPAYLQTTNRTKFMVSTGCTSDGSAYFLGTAGAIDVLTTTWKDILGSHFRIGQTTSSTGYFAHIYKIIGINRISGGNQ